MPLSNKVCLSLKTSKGSVKGKAKLEEKKRKKGNGELKQKGERNNRKGGKTKNEEEKTQNLKRKHNCKIEFSPIIYLCRNK